MQQIAASKRSGIKKHGSSLEGMMLYYWKGPIWPLHFLTQDGSYNVAVFDLPMSIS